MYTANKRIVKFTNTDYYYYTKFLPIQALRYEGLLNMDMNVMVGIKYYEDKKDRQHLTLDLMRLRF